MPNLFAQIPMGRPATLEELAMSYAPMARHWAFKTFDDRRAAQRSLDDLVQDAWIGILEAWHIWEPGRGATFRTYANDRAKWAVLNGQRLVDAGLARVYVNRIRAKDKEQAEALYSNVLAMGSLDTAQNLEDRRNEIPKHQLPDPAAEAAHYERVSWGSFMTLLDMVSSPRVRQIFMDHFGRGLTLAEIARRQGVSRERIRQLVVEGKQDIRQGLKREIEGKR